MTTRSGPAAHTDLSDQLPPQPNPLRARPLSTTPIVPGLTRPAGGISELRYENVHRGSVRHRRWFPVDSPCRTCTCGARNKITICAVAY
jgi:hypothetical protein